VDGGRHSDIAAVPAVAAAGTSAGNVFLAPESEAAIAAITRFYGDSYFIYKHEKRPLVTTTSGPAPLN
jgi:hypothetical protein